MYVALCYSKLDYFDVSQEILASYQAAQPDSMLAANLKACNQFKCVRLRRGHQGKLGVCFNAPVASTGYLRIRALNPPPLGLLISCCGTRCDWRRTVVVQGSLSTARLFLPRRRLFNGKAAEAEIKALADACGGAPLDNDLIKHNLVVFRGGEGAVQVSAAACV